MSNASLPKNYEIAKEVLKDHYTVASSVLDPVLLISGARGGFRCELMGKRIIRGRELLSPAPSLEHNWVFEGNSIKPLPVDVCKKLEELAGPLENWNPTYSFVVKISLMTLDWIETRISANTWDAPEWQNKIAEESQIPNLRASLLPYQRQGVEWMKDATAQIGGLVLADEMGLGKTIQIIALLLAHQFEYKTPALVICPTSLVANWKTEIHKFAPTLKLLIHQGPARAGIPRFFEGADIVITTYETAAQDRTLLGSLIWKFMICDEAQALKNPYSRRRKAIGTIPRLYTILMTGTPLETSLLDIWSLIDLLIPNGLGTTSDFETRFCEFDDSIVELKKIITPVILRRTVDQVANDLPERRDIDIPLELSLEDIQRYETIRQEALEEFEKSGALVASTRLQLFTAHRLIAKFSNSESIWQHGQTKALSKIDEYWCPKLKTAYAIIKEAFENKRKVLLFANYNRVAPLIEALPLDFSQNFFGVLNGQTPQSERQELVDQFSATVTPGLMVLNPKVAGAGLNITAATVVIHFTQTWNPATQMQASARAYRRGQKKPVFIYRLYYQGTVEEVMIERSQRRKELGEELLPNQLKGREDARALLTRSPLK